MCTCFIFDYYYLLCESVPCCSCRHTNFLPLESFMFRTLLFAYSLSQCVHCRFGMEIVQAKRIHVAICGKVIIECCHAKHDQLVDLFEIIIRTKLADVTV